MEDGTMASRSTAVLVAGLVALSLLDSAGQQVRAQAPANTTIFEGARLIVGDGTTIEDAAFVVDRGRFGEVGRRGSVQAPAGAARVSLAGKTVIPALVDGHSHIGYQKGPSTSVKNYTRENILDHLSRFAYYGVAASQSMGSDFGEMPYELQREIFAGKYPDAARFFNAGRGLAPPSEIAADNMRHAAYVVTTEEGARADVRELAAHGVTLAKTWVRATPKMPPALYAALIDEAHRNNIRVAVHATELEDAKGLLRAGIDVFAHMIDEVDDELVELFKQHPDTVVLPTLAAPRLATTYAPWLDPLDPLLAVTQPPEHIKQLRDRLAATRPEARQRADAAWDKLARGLKRLKAAGVRLGLGTDGGGQNGGYVGWTAHAELENLVAAGLTPMETIVLATRTTAEILRIDELGTVARGKSGDFVVLDANPLENITNSRRISRVYLRGHEVDRARLAAAWKSGALSN
jgi:imidazolonepropionase-like amidohydrolase